MAAADVFAQVAGEPLERTRKADGTIVTRVDTALDAWLRVSLSTLLPEAAWLSEESADDLARLSAQWVWIVDPLDGTKELARGVPECAISIGLVHDGTVRAGGVLNPYSGLGAATGVDGSWVAWPDELLSRSDVDRAATSISRSETEDGTITPYLDLFTPTRSIGSVANKLLRVACGLERMTVSVQPKSEWDVCGGVALLHAKHMVLTRIDGTRLAFNQSDTRIPGGFVAGLPEEVDARIGKLRQLIAEQRTNKSPSE